MTFIYDLQRRGGTMYVAKVGQHGAMEVNIARQFDECLT